MAGTASDARIDEHAVGYLKTCTLFDRLELPFVKVTQILKEQLDFHMEQDLHMLVHG
jgi:hypothetical protein